MTTHRKNDEGTMTTWDYRDSHMGRGQDYHAIFTESPHTAKLWQMERSALDQAVQRFFPVEPPTHLDFACGTGRILHHLQPLVASSVGVDISASMLEVARKNSPSAQFIVGDLTQDDLLQGQSFDLITAFRFFPNAQPDLRSQVMSKLAELLTPRGIIVFNNHLNADSLYQSLLARTGRDPGHAMPMSEVDDLVASSGLQIRQESGFMLVPVPFPYFDRAPGAFGGIEQAISRANLATRHCQDVMLIAARAEAGAIREPHTNREQ